MLAEHGRMLQVVHEFYDPGLTVSRVELLAELSMRYGIATTLSPLFHTAAAPGATDQVMEAVERAWARRRAGVAAGADPADRHLLDAVPAQHHVPGHPRLVEHAVDGRPRRQAGRAGQARGPREAPRRPGRHHRARGVPAWTRPTTSSARSPSTRNRDLVGRTLGDVAEDRGTTAGELLIDLSIEEELGTWFQRADIGHSDPEAVGALLAHPLVHVGASDGGAHVGSFATYGDTGFLLSRYVRETGALSLEAAVKKITADPCTIWGLPERGQLKEGYAADIVVFDPDTIDRGPEVASGDFPGGGTRWIRNSVGVDTVVVNGEVTWTDADGYAPKARAGVIATA